MAVGVQSAARLICEQGDWEVTNLALQKILYIAHMVHMGRNNGARLINRSFEAWDYGPVQPDLYQRVKMFGSRPIQDVFFGATDIEGTEEAKTIEEACQHLLSKSPGELVAMTHWKGGAWSKHYAAGTHGIVIPDADILREYRDRTGKN